jgi:hypothetical protein
MFTRELFWFRRYIFLTAIVFLPLVWAFLTVNNLYPIPVWSLFSESVDLNQGRTYYVLRGVEMDGETIDIPAIEITDGLSGRNHMMVYYVVGNESFQLESPHPANVALQADQPGAALQPAERIEELLTGWGSAYNARKSEGSAKRLQSIMLQEYQWEGGRYENFTKVGRKWSVEL